MLNVDRCLLILVKLSIASLLRPLLTIMPCTVEATHGVLVLLYLYIVSAGSGRGDLSRNTLISLRNRRLGIWHRCVPRIGFISNIGLLTIHNAVRLAHLLLYLCVLPFLFGEVPNLQLIFLNCSLVAGKLLIVALFGLGRTLIYVLHQVFVGQHGDLEFLLRLILTLGKHGHGCELITNYKLSSFYFKIQIENSNIWGFGVLENFAE